MRNPLLEPHDLPPFSDIRPEHVVPAVDTLLEEHRARLGSLLRDGNPLDWPKLMAPLEEMNQRLADMWSPVRHMNSVVNTDALREAYTSCLPKLSVYWTEIGQNAELYRACKSIRGGEAWSQLDAPQRRVVDNMLRDFELSGVSLPDREKARFKEMAEELSELGSSFSNNVLDATNAWEKHLMDASRLGGLPESARSLSRQAAGNKGLDGWLLTLDYPCYVPVMTFAEDRELRRELYEAFVTRASDRGPHAGRFDNGPNMERILALRHAQSRLLGFANFAERSLARKMARSPEEVLEFLHDLVNRCRPQALAEYDDLCEYAGREHGVNELAAWDVMYYSEKLRQSRYALSQEELRPYFPEDRVIPGMFAVVERLFGIRILPVVDVDTWHPDVRVYEVQDDSGERRALFYLDLYARSQKRGGAWMDECRSRWKGRAGVQLPVAYLTCNSTPPVEGDPALFTHEEVITLFHEFGHGLHHMLTRIDHASISGMGGVEWDAVELPSQFMENWCWEREALNLISGHHETGEPIPEDLYRRMRAARNFQSAMAMVRQLEFALFDFRLHLQYDPGRDVDIIGTWNRVRDEVAVVPIPEFNRFPNAFTHIFSGGYAAGYYSYKWAEVLSADAYSAFEENGVFDRETGEAFRRSVLEVGGSRDALESFVAFRGRKPSLAPLLRHSGIDAMPN